MDCLARTSQLQDGYLDLRLQGHLHKLDQVELLNRRYVSAGTRLSTQWLPQVCPPPAPRIACEALPPYAEDHFSIRAKVSSHEQLGLHEIVKLSQFCLLRGALDGLDDSVQQQLHAIVDSVPFAVLQLFELFFEAFDQSGKLRRR